MRIAIPTSDGRLALHFGHCKQFALIDVDERNKRIVADELVEAPDHQPGLLPKWLHEQGVNLVIAGGMGSRAVQLFTQSGIEVCTGAPSETPRALVEAYLNGTLDAGQNVCDH